jgi:hypothetical protein
MDSERKVSQEFNNNPKGSRPRGQKKEDGGTVYKEILGDAKLKTGKRGQKTELNGRSPLRRRRSAFDCSAT